MATRAAATGHECIVPGCKREGRNRLGVRCRIAHDGPTLFPEKGKTAALFSPDADAFLCDQHALGGFFEIEHSTSVYSGLLRFNDVMIDFPITEAFVVGDGDKTQRKFEREIARRTFEHSDLINVTRFLLYEQVRQTWLRYRSVGAGSKAWGSDLAGTTQKLA